MIGYGWADCGKNNHAERNLWEGLFPFQLVLTALACSAVESGILWNPFGRQAVFTGEDAWRKLEATHGGLVKLGSAIRIEDG